MSTRAPITCAIIAANLGKQKEINSQRSPSPNAVRALHMSVCLKFS